MRGYDEETWRSCNYYVRSNKGLHILDRCWIPNILLQIVVTTNTCPTTNSRHIHTTLPNGDN